mmetsp:Transcript_15566/g.26771  ORF Transcript_15566/g.26771 Transcript_15566/m.26771 type:complete len:96 (-) Transcript_15566:1049-1336(-)
MQRDGPRLGAVPQPTRSEQTVSKVELQRKPILLEGQKRGASVQKRSPYEVPSHQRQLAERTERKGTNKKQALSLNGTHVLLRATSFLLAKSREQL